LTDKELKKLKKTDLLRIMVAQSKEIDRLTQELEETKAALESREITIGKSGSIAEASLALYEVIERAQKAADLYLENARRLSGQADVSFETGVTKTLAGAEDNK